MSDIEDLAALETRTRALLASDRLTLPTREALQRRLDVPVEPVDLLSATQRRTLEALCPRLIPEPALVRRIGLARRFEALLAKGSGRGWRHADAPDDVALNRDGLAALDAGARDLHGRAFADLAARDQDALLSALCEGRLEAACDPRLYRWFEEMLTALVGLYYAHPLVQVSIGYDGMADAQGVSAVGLKAVAAEAGHHEP